MNFYLVDFVVMSLVLSSLFLFLVPGLLRLVYV